MGERSLVDWAQGSILQCCYLRLAPEVNSSIHKATNFRAKSSIPGGCLKSEQYVVKIVQRLAIC